VIIKTFDNGWGNDVPLKQMESEIVSQYLSTATDRTVLINSTWYTVDFHVQVMSQLRDMEFDRIVLVSMLDAAIPQPEWYEEFDCPVHALGYYPGADTIDFWALTVGQHFDTPTYNVMNSDTIDCAYMCLNRKPHWHRKKLYQQLHALNIIDRGIVSMGGNNTPPERLLDQDQGQSDLAPNSGTEQNGIANDIMSLGHPDNWQRCFLNVVTETQFDIQKSYFVSEKIYKPILGCRPFLVYATDGAVNWLSKQGFENYTKDFADISDLDLTNPNNLAPFLSVLCQQSRQYWQMKFVALHDKIVYNNNNFQQYVTSINNQIKQGIKCQI
jgi:hypothetical protein